VPSVIFHNVDFNYDSPYTEVFRGLSLLIDTRWKTAIVARNGRGKTTLLQMVHRSIQPNGGSLEVPIQTTYFPYSPVDSSETAFNVIKDSVAPFRQWQQSMAALLEKAGTEELDQYGTLAERYLAAGGYEIDAAIHREFQQMGLPEDILQRPFGSLSGGEQTRALITALFLNRDHYPLIDEPTNHLDMTGREQLTEYLATKQGFLLVSHDRFLLDTCIDHVISINQDDIRTNSGNYTRWKQQMDLENEFERRTRENLQREIKHLHKASQQRRAGAEVKEKEKKTAYDKGFVGHRAAKQMKKALIMENRIKANLEEKSQLLKNVEKDRLLKIDTDNNSPEILLTINNLYVAIEEHPIIRNFSLKVNRGDRVAIVGPNGCGKTTLFNAICNDIAADAGTIALPAYVEVIRSFQNPLWSAGKLRDYLEFEGMDETRFRQILGVFGVEGDLFEHPLE